MKKFTSEFKAFALKSNVLDLAIAVIMGGAAGKMVTSLVESVLMPLIGVLLGGLDFSSLEILVGDAAIKYGAFIQSIFDFLIISLCVFFAMKAVNRLATQIPHEDKEEEAKKPTTEELLTEIRDLLAEKN